MIKNVVFDFGGVVIDWNPHYAYDPYFGDRAKSDWFLANICTWAWNNCQDAGRPFAEAVASLSAEYPEWSAEIALFRERWEEMVGGLVPGTSEIIARLKKAGYRVFGLTNWSGETFPLVRHKFAVLDLLEDIVVSGNEKIVKPDPRLYQILLDRNALVPDECLFIDDSKKNTDAAEGVGMHSLLFVDAGRLESDLKALGLDF